MSKLYVEGPKVDLDGLMRKWSEDPHRDKHKGYEKREGGSVNVSELIKGLDARVDQIRTEREKEEADAEDREKRRRQLHPDQYEEMMQQRGDL